MSLAQADILTVFSALLTDGVRSLHADTRLPTVMEIVTRASVASMAGVAEAGLTVRASERLATKAPTSQLPVRVDAFQYQHGGPCVSVLSGPAVVLHVDDLTTEARWPAFTAAATAHTPVSSMLSYRLYLDRDDPIASLNLYALQPRAFDPDTVRVGEQLAAQAALALAYAKEQDKARNLERALDTSRDIGVALGILMSRHLVTREQAFDLLRQASQRSHRKLRELAQQVLATGDLS